jgi:hypothetical protein
MVGDGKNRWFTHPFPKRKVKEFPNHDPPVSTDSRLIRIHGEIQIFERHGYRKRIEGLDLKIGDVMLSQRRPGCCSKLLLWG